MLLLLKMEWRKWRQVYKNVDVAILAQYNSCLCFYGQFCNHISVVNSLCVWLAGQLTDPGLPMESSFPYPESSCSARRNKQSHVGHSSQAPKLTRKCRVNLAPLIKLLLYSSCVQRNDLDSRCFEFLWAFLKLRWSISKLVIHDLILTRTETYSMVLMSLFYFVEDIESTNIKCALLGQNRNRQCGLQDFDVPRPSKY